MDHISKHLTHSSNLINQSQTHKDISNRSNKEFETEFAKLWLYLESLYVNQKFNITMGGVNSSTARAWRIEFKRNGISEKELIFIRENLSKLEKPEYIPNSLTLMALLKKETAKECRTQLGPSIDPRDLPSQEEIEEKRNDTKSIRNECMNTINYILNRKEIPKEEKEKSWMEIIAPGPTDKMVRLIHNHNRLLIAQGLSPLHMPNCKRRSFEMGLK